MNIISVFSGRKSNLEILTKYLQKALELKIIDEVHFWNNTRNSSDEEYLKSIANLRRTSSSGCGNYIKITPEIKNNCFELNVKATSDVHIKLIGRDEYEIVLGGWSNTKSVVRKNNKEIFCLDGSIDYENITISIDDKLNIFTNTTITCEIEPFEITDIYFKTGFNSIGELRYKETQNSGFYFMDTCEKSWKNYYNHYNDKQFENDIIIKCDDDIVFIDVNKLPSFIDFVKNNDYDLVFANTINNGVCAYIQQKDNLIPKSVIDLTRDVCGGRLWASGKYAERLHNYFINNYKTFLERTTSRVIPINVRLSINFFGFKGKNWHKLNDCYDDDEEKLTIEYVKKRGFKNVLYTDFYVSHLSFYKQIETGINLKDLINKYHQLHAYIES